MGKKKLIVVAVFIFLALVFSSYYFTRRSANRTGNPEIAAAEAKFAAMAKEPRDVSSSDSESERALISQAAVKKLKAGVVVPGREQQLADAFAEFLTAYRSEEPGRFVDYYHHQGVPLDAAGVGRVERSWAKTSLMTVGRKVDIESIRFSTIRKSVANSVTDSAANSFVQWISSEKANVRGVNISDQTPVYCVTINVAKHELGTGGPYSLSIGFVPRDNGRSWIPVMNWLQGISDRPVAHPPL